MQHLTDIEIKAMEIRELAPFMKEHVKQNRNSLLSAIEECTIPEIRQEYLWILERGLVEKQQVLTESTFISEHSRALAIYHAICEENGYEPKLPVGIKYHIL